MIGRSHIVLGVASAATASAAGWVPFSLATLMSAALGSLAPDLDTERSMLGCRVPWLSRPLSRLVGHRTVTHSLAVPGALALALIGWLGAAGFYSPFGGFLVGYVSHIVADLMTGGCWALYPLARGRLALWPHAKTGSFREYLLLLFCLGGLGYMSYLCLVQNNRPAFLQSATGSHRGRSLPKHHMAFIA